MTPQTNRRTFSNGVLSQRTRTHKVRLVALLASTALAHATVAPAQSLPSGGQVAAGSITIGTPSAGALTINQTSGSAVVNWQSFNVGKANRVTFVQPDANAAILNRVTGETSSTISGQINANGQVYLINPNGIAITSSGTVKAGAFVASTLGISDDDFMGGKRSFTGDGASAPVTNAGAITINRGGYMALIGGTVANAGVITVPMGKAALGSGEQATLDLSGDGFLQVAVPTKAGGGGALVDNSGKISARGGTVQLTAAAAKDMARQAVNMSGTIEANGVSGKSGDITLTGGDGEVAVSGTLDAGNAAGKGGKVTVTGRSIKLASAKVNASGKTGGGTVNIGGNRQGKGPLQHAETLDVDAHAVINADAVTTGTGGDVVLWSDDLTNFAGTITAKGGAISGNGGEAEVSGKAKLSYTGLTDLTAAHGSFGNLLLDPYNVTISTGTGSNTDGGFNATGNDSVINVNTLTNALATANVTVTTGGFGSAGSQAGDITVAAPIVWSSGSTLTLSAYRNIAVNAAITNTGGANVNLRADNSGLGSGTVSFGTSIQVSTAGAVNIYYNPTSNPATGTPSVNATSYMTATDYSGYVTGGGALSAYMLVNNVYDLQNVNNNLSGTYALGRDIDASVTAGWNSGAGFKPIGTLSMNASYAYSGTPFYGVFDGQNYAISNLTINRPSTNVTGLFTGNSGQIRNFGVTSGSITGNIYVGGLVGQNYGNIINSFSGASVSGYRYSGGLVADHEGGVIRSSYATGDVSNTLRGQGSGGDSAGGLVGYNRAAVVGSYATGNVYAQGGMAGGLVGQNIGSISQSYATGSVTAIYAGGLVGTQVGSITQSYATGPVNGSYAPQSGGLIAYEGAPGSNVTNSYWDTQTTGQSSGMGGSTNGTFQATGLTTAQFANSANMPGLTFGTTPGASGFVIVDPDGTFNNASGVNGATRPFLLSEYSTSIANAHQLQLISLAPSASYTLMRNIDLSAALGSSSGNWFTSNVLGDGYGFVPIGGSGHIPFLGTFDGGGHTISNLSISRYDYSGLFGYIGTGGTIQNVGVVNGTVAGGYFVGMVAGQNEGTITNVYSTGTVSGSKYVGGLVGFDANTISRSYSLAAVTAPFYAGGLVGQENGTISQSYAGGSVSGQQFVGGLVGLSGASATISDAYASAAVTGTSPGTNVGGLVGYNFGTITRTYATGAVTGSSAVGGLVGYNNGSIANSFWDTTTTGLSQGYGSNSGTFNAAGLTTAQLQDLSSYSSTYTGWDFQNVWAPPNQVGQNNGATVAHYPELYAFLTVLTIAPNAVTRNYGDTNPALTATYYGNLRPGDSFASLASLFTSAGQFSNVGDYAITASGASVTSPSGNAYRLVYIPGTLTVNGRPLTVTADAKTRVYGDTTDPTLTYQITGGSLLNGDQLTGNLTTLASSATGVGNYAINQGTLGNSNYAITYVSANETITARQITVAADATSRAYGDANPTFTYMVGGAGLVNGDTLSGSLATLATETSGVGNYLITQGTLGNPNYSITSYTGNDLQITPRQVTVTADQTSRYYGDSNPTLTYSVGGAGLVNGDSFSGSLHTMATVGSGVGNYGITQGTLFNSNYTISSYTGANLIVSQRPITITADAKSRYYGDANPALTYSVSGPGLVNGDTLSGSLTTLAAATSDVGAYGIAQGSLGASLNYSVSYVAANLSVTPRPIAVTANAQSKVYGNADPMLTYTVGGNGLVNGDTLSGLLSRTAGENVIGGGYAIGQGSVTNTNNPNYAISYTGNTLTVTPLMLTITPNSGQSKTYGNADPTFTYVASGQVVNPTLGIDDSGLALTGTLGRAVGETVAGGPYAYTLNTLSAGGNYTLAMATSPATFTINPATLTYLANTATRQYGSTNPPLSGTVTGYVNGDTAATAVTGSMTFTSNATGASGVGDYGITGSGLTANNGNYVFVQDAGNTTALSVTPRSITVLANAQSKVYGAADPALTYMVGGNGLVNGDTLSGLLSRTAGENVIGGGYAIGQGSVNNINNPNYAISYTGNTLTITPATLTYVAGAAARQYGDANPALSGILSGFVNGDTQATAVNGTLTFATSVTTTSGVGTYAITGTGLTVNNGNYVFAQSPGNLTALSITPRAITVTADAQSQAYGDASPALSYAIGGGGLVNGDTLSGSLASLATATSNVGGYAITQGSLAASSNYALTFSDATLTVVPRAITVTADGVHRTYGDANPGLTYTVGGSGLVNGDALSGALATSATTASGIGNYGITLGTLANSNYNISFTGADLAISPRALTVTADAKSKTYGDANPALTYTTSGLVNNDTLSGSLVTSAGQYSGVGGYGITLGSLGNANYAITYNAANLTVTPRAMTVTADAKSKTYGDANPALTYTTSGLVNSDTLSGSLSTSGGQYSNVGSYGITLGGLGNANYAITYNAANLTVTPRAMTVMADAKSKTYGDANPALTYTTSGLVNGDTLSGSLSTAAGQYSDVGGYGITLGSLGNANYAITYNAANLTITPRALAVTADALSRAYGDANPTLTYTTSGLVNNDTLSGSLSTSAGQYSDVGAYAIAQGTLANANYAIGYTGANLTVTPRALTVTADALSKIYGDANPTLTYTATGLVNGDTLSGSLVTTAGQYANVGSYAITDSFSASSNYALTYVGANLSVNRRAITVTADTLSKTYGDANPALIYTVGGAGLVNGDMLSGSLSTMAGQYSNVGSYAIAGSFSASSNYALTYVGANLSVNRRAITVTADTLSKTYGDANPMLTYAATGLLNGDTLSGSLSTTAGQYSDVGAYAITLGSLANANYAISYMGADLTVNQRAITVAADSLSRRYGLANPALTYTVGGAGLVNGDRLSGGLATSATSLSEPGAYAITQGTLLASANYRMNFVPGVLTVEKTANPEPGTQASSVMPSFDAGRFAPIRPVSDGTETADGSHDVITDPRFEGTFVCLDNGNGCVSLPGQATP
ncbi:MBG domain-containing protein [Rhizobium sp. SG570]|uniref:MBG domain-containing protein n=1 Tax=Rhizobium sp. SG570 TaxID=2587113 RepID=UPI0014466572|nr:MBG domain-containing protein [Rhizobium sp. SG570]NKJ39995.1 filamentous hemagglutinin family protein [Rhizobium sp. SG570]